MSDPVVGRFYVRGGFYLVDVPGSPAYMPAVGTIIELSDAGQVSGLLNRGKIEPADEATAARVRVRAGIWNFAKHSLPNPPPNWALDGPEWK